MIQINIITWAYVPQASDPMRVQVYVAPDGVVMQKSDPPGCEMSCVKQSGAPEHLSPIYNVATWPCGCVAANERSVRSLTIQTR